MEWAIGPLSVNMIQHIVTMNVVAPILAIIVMGHLPSGLWRGWHWATGIQLGAFWLWHAPPFMNAAMALPVIHVIMQFSLFAAALLFWSAVLTLPPSRRWIGIFSLLITAKLFCLLAALLIFAGRPLFAMDVGGAGNGMGLADQELAGLIMIVACPLFYVTAGIYLAAKWLFEAEDQAHSPNPNR